MIPLHAVGVFIQTAKAEIRLCTAPVQCLLIQLAGRIPIALHALAVFIKAAFAQQTQVTAQLDCFFIMLHGRLKTIFIQVALAEISQIPMGQTAAKLGSLGKAVRGLFAVVGGTVQTVVVFAALFDRQISWRGRRLRCGFRRFLCGRRGLCTAAGGQRSQHGQCKQQSQQTGNAVSLFLHKRSSQ